MTEKRKQQFVPLGGGWLNVDVLAKWLAQGTKAPVARPVFTRARTLPVVLR